MKGVAVDLFHIDLAKNGPENFDTMLVCVSRHSGWIIALPFFLDKGLTGPKVSQMLLKEWRTFGMHSIITTDQGSHFIGE